MKTTNTPSKRPEFFLGIDVGKADLFCHIQRESTPSSKRCDNTEAGVKALLTWLKSKVDLALTAACLEQTGHYGRLVSDALYRAEVAAIYLVNPRQIKAYGNQKLRRNKSDTADAKLIAEFVRAEHHDLRVWVPKSPDNKRITVLSRYAESITRDVAELKTRCESAEEKVILRSLRKRIKAGEREIADIRTRINAIIAADGKLTQQTALLHSIPGIAEVTGHVLIAELPDIGLFEDARQLAAWAGVTPRHFISGTSGRTKTPITKVGSAALRAALFMPAMNAKTWNPQLKEFAERLRKRGKTKMQIIVAVMRKLLHQIYGILKSGKPFDPAKRGRKCAAEITAVIPYKT